MNKTCKDCGETKELNLFRKQGNTCKECFKLWTKRYEKTKKGFTMRLYRNMKSRITGVQKLKFHLYEGKYLLSKEDFYAWISVNKDFDRLFKEYEDSGYDRKLAPSVDRVDSSIGYTLDNMELVTSSENSRRSNIKEVYEGKGNI